MALYYLFVDISANGVPFSFNTYCKTISYIPSINWERLHLPSLYFVHIWEGGTKDLLLFKVSEHEPSKTNKGEKWNRICNVKKHPNYRGQQIERVSLTDPTLRRNIDWENDIAVLTLCTELKFELKVI